MTARSPTIRLGMTTDAGDLAVLAERTFLDAFAADNDLSQMDAHMASAFGESQQRRELEDASFVTVLAELEGALVGFAQLRMREPPPACVTGPAPVELWRLYVDRPWHGRGIAQSLLDAVEEAARRVGGKTLWLGVWERNHRAIAFYCKCAFQDVGDHEFVLGTERQQDRIMVRAIGIRP